MTPVAFHKHLGLLLLLAWGAFYLRLFWAQPRPEGLPLKTLPFFGNTTYGGAPPWPAVEWNVWQGWRDSLPLQVAFYVCFLFASRAARGSQPLGSPRDPNKLAAIGLFFGVVLRGALGTVLTVLVTGGVYCLSRSHSTKVLVWLFTLTCMQLVFCYLSSDSEAPCALEKLLPILVSLPFPLGVRGSVPWSTFRYDALRLISYASDVADEMEPNFMALLAYQLYPPLVCAGPVVTYGDFLGQVVAPVIWPSEQLALYTLRTLGLGLLVEVSLFFFYFPAWLAPTTSREALANTPSWVLFGGIHFCLIFEWFSLAVVWGVPRAVALIDGVATQENMPRPILFPVSFREVWRDWHSSLNLWSVKYIYRPLGGRRCPWISVSATFVFIAFWHDIRGLGDRPYWYVWAALNSFFLLFESSLKGPTSSKLSVQSAALGGLAAFCALVVANLPAIMYENSFVILQALLGTAPMWLYIFVASSFAGGAVFIASKQEAEDDREFMYSDSPR